MSDTETIRKLRVIHLEDDPGDRFLIANAMHSEGFNCGFERATNEKEFREVLDQVEPDLILSDFTLPGFDGAIALLIANSRRPEVPFVFVTGTIGEEHAVELLKCGATDWVRKDRLQRLGAVVRRALREARERAERLEAEAALRQREEEFRAIFEVASIGMAQADVLTGQWRRVNNKMCDITGYSREELLQKRVPDITHPEDRQRDWELFQRVVRGESPEYRLEKRYLRKDGSVAWVNVNMTVLRDATGNPTRTMAAIGDITERKKLERDLSEALQFNQTVIAASSLGLSVYRASGECILANTAAARIVGATVDELCRQNFRQLESWQRSGLLEAACQALAQGNEIRREARAFSTFGTEFWTSCRLTPFTALGQPHLLLMMEDISGRKLAEEALRDSEQRQRSVLDTIPDPAWLKDLDSRYLAVNQAWCRFAGKQISEVIGKTELDLLPAETARLFREADLEVINQRKQKRKEQFVKDAQGRPVWYETVIDAIYNEEGQPVGTVGIARDISERRELETELRQAQKMESIGQLAGGVAHDFNNLLAVMRCSADLLLMDAKQNSPQTNECLQQIAAAAERAAGLTRQLLIFGRKQAMQSEPLQLNELVKNLTKMLTRVIREDIRLECRYTEQAHFIQADPGMMEQVVLNLVVNARDAMPRGGQLLIATDALSFNAEYSESNPEARAGDFVCLSVSDTGLGIAPEHLERIFEPFFTTKEPGKGTGLGLATVYGIVKQHQGWVKVLSRVGEGTTFKIFLPAIPPPPKAAAGQTEAKLVGGSETILLVEDDCSVRTITRQVLETFKYKVHEATCAREAMEVWTQHAGEIALLVTDMVMPEGVTGRDLAEGLRTHRPELKVIFMSGYSAEALGKDTEFFRRPGFYFLHKPCTAATLIRTVRSCLDAQDHQGA